MSRRKKTSLAEDLTEIVAMLPWWAGVGLALVSYLWLHSVAAQPVRVAAAPGQIGASLATGVFTAMASALQYIVPMLCLAGAGLSAYKRHQRQALLLNTARSPAADVLNGMTWQQFEQLVGEAFRVQGFRVAETGGGGADGGVDLVLTRGAEKHLVQCKQWRAFKVGVDVVRELYGVMAATGAAGGYVVTSGRFTDEATAFASGRNVKLIDGPQLHKLIASVQTARVPASTRDQVAMPTKAQVVAGGTAPSCPVCSEGMVRRTAKKGGNAGQEFWGCKNYPRCRGTRPIV